MRLASTSWNDLRGLSGQKQLICCDALRREPTAKERMGIPQDERLERADSRQCGLGFEVAKAGC
jgi:hypothetical protein